MDRIIRLIKLAIRIAVRFVRVEVVILFQVRFLTKDRESQNLSSSLISMILLRTFDIEVENEIIVLDTVGLKKHILLED